MATLCPAGFHPLRFLCVCITAVGLVASFGNAMAQTPNAPPQNAGEHHAGGAKAERNADAVKQRYWTTRWEFKDVDANTLTDRLAAIGIDLGIDVRGVVTVRFDVGIPWTSLSDGAAYRFDGTLTSPQLVVEGVEFKNLETTVNYRNGVATLSKLKTYVVDASGNASGGATGQIEGQGTVQLVPRKNATAELQVENISLAPFSELIAKFAPAQKARLPQAGSLSGEIRFQAPLDTIDQVKTYELDGSIECRRLKLANLPPASVSIASIAIHDGRLRIGGLDLKAGENDRIQSGIRLVGQADVPLDDQGNFSFELIGDDLPLGDIASLASPSSTSTFAIVAGKLDFRVKGNGTIGRNAEESTWSLAGSIASPDFQVAGIDLGILEHDIKFTPTRLDVLPRRDGKSLPATFKLERMSSQYRISDHALTIESMEAKVFGGQISGSAILPGDDQGDLVVTLTVEGLRPRVQIPVAGNFAAVLAATISGDVDWRVPVSKWSSPTMHHGTAKLAAHDITLGDKSVGSLTANVSADDGRLSLQASGELFGGTVEVETLAEMNAEDGWSDLSRRLMPSKLRFESVSIDTMSDLVTGQSFGLSGHVSGLVSADFESWNQVGSVFPKTEISFELASLTHRSRFLARKLSLKGKIENDIFAIENLVGDYAGGSARLTGRVYLANRDGVLRPRADLRCTATRVYLEHGMWFIGDAAEQLQGRLSFNVTIAGYQESLRLRGSVAGRELAAYDLPIGSAHSGLVANANLQSLRWDLSFPSVRSSVGGGQLEGELYLSSARRGGVDLSSRWKTRRVDFFRLTNQLGRPSSVARGEISGMLSLRGKSVQSIDDLAGRFDFQLGQTRGAAIPGLIGASQFLGPVSLAQQSFDVGNVKGIFGQGALVIDEFWLGSDNALVQADGKIFLRSGRMDIHALIATGDYRDIAANFAQLAQKYALRSFLPASAILSVSELLRDRTLVVAVGGTMQNPIVRLRPIETFREEAARFLLREGQRLILTGITAGAVDGLDGGF